MAIVWSLQLRLAFTDGSHKEVTALKAPLIGFQFFGGTAEDFEIATQLPELNAFLKVIGYGDPSDPPGPPANIADFSFRFMAITTNGEINVLGGTDELADEVITNNLLGVLDDLNADDDFASFMTEISGVPEPEPFDPFGFPDLELYYDARVGESVITSSPGVSLWKDLVGNTHPKVNEGGAPIGTGLADMKAITSGKEPTFIEADPGFSGQPVLSFDGTTDHMFTGESGSSFVKGAPGFPLTMIAVLSAFHPLPTPESTDHYGIVVAQVAGGLPPSVGGSGWLHFTSDDGPFNLIHWSDTDDVDDDLVVPHAPGTTLGPAILVATMGGTYPTAVDLKLWIDGGPAATGLLTSVTHLGTGTSASTMSIGKGLLFHTEMKIGFLVFYSRVLSLSEINTALSGLSSEYGIPVSTAT